MICQSSNYYAIILMLTQLPQRVHCVSQLLGIYFELKRDPTRGRKLLRNKSFAHGQFPSQLLSKCKLCVSCFTKKLATIASLKSKLFALVPVSTVWIALVPMNSFRRLDRRILNPVLLFIHIFDSGFDVMNLFEQFCTCSNWFSLVNIHQPNNQPSHCRWSFKSWNALRRLNAKLR